MKYYKVLKAPEAYWTLGKIQKELICNGVGPQGYGFLFPETVWGLCVSEAADIHDYMYYAGKTLESKAQADTWFLDNLLFIINTETKWGWLKALRTHRAKLMYAAVDKFGSGAFGKGKK